MGKTFSNTEFKISAFSSSGTCFHDKFFAIGGKNSRLILWENFKILSGKIKTQKLLINNLRKQEFIILLEKKDYFSIAQFAFKFQRPNKILQAMNLVLKSIKTTKIMENFLKQ